LANLLDQEREESDRKQGAHGKLLNHGSARATALRNEILNDTACEIRNLTASSALEAYFRLAETEARSELAEKAAAVAAEAMERGRELKARGVKTPSELDTLERKQIDLQADTAQLRLAQARLQHDLKALLGPPANSPRNLIRPVLDMDAYVAPGDSAAEVARGLASRPELRMWRTLGESLDAATLPVAQSAIQAVNPLAGGALDKGTHSCGALLKVVLEMCKGRADVEAVRRQILTYGAEREQQIASDIRRDVRYLAIQTEILILARRRAASNHRHVEEVVDGQAKGINSFADTAQARLEYLKARGTVVEAAATLLIYQAKLRQGQGLLAAECWPGCQAATPIDAGSIPGTTAP
jgi:outer membrane protein TolC